MQGLNYAHALFMNLVNISSLFYDHLEKASFTLHFLHRHFYFSICPQNLELSCRVWNSKLSSTKTE
jgi:hypothetical protein